VLLAFPLTFLFLRLVGSYWSYFGMGSSGGNGFALLFWYAPVTLASFLGVSGLTCFALWVRTAGGLKIFIAGVVSMIAAFVLGFSLEVWRTADYPTSVQGGVLHFLWSFVKRLV
jgi:hypothetical protein